MFYKYRRLLPYMLRHWQSLVAIVVMSAALSAISVLQPWPLKILVDYALGDTPLPAVMQSPLRELGWEGSAWNLVMVAGVASIVLFLASGALDAGLSWAWARAGQGMVYQLAAHMFARFQRLSLLFHNRRSVGDSLDRLSADSWCVYTVAGLLVAPLQHMLTVAGITAAAWALDRQLTILTLVVAPLMAIAARTFGPRLKRRARQGREAQSRLASFVHQTLTTIPLVQAFGTAPANAARFRVLADDAVALAQRGVLLDKTYALVNGLTTSATTAAVLYAGSLRVLSGAMSIGSLLVFLAYLKSIHSSLQELFGIHAKLKAAEASLDRVLEILDVGEEVPESANPQSLPSLVAGPRGRLEWEGVSFGYVAGQPVLEDVSLAVRPGETIALVGPTGGGKSTLVSLVPRFFDPCRGRVLFDGIDVRDLRLATLRSQIALVFQEPFLLPLTVAENIAYGRPEANRTEIEAAAKAANADGFIRRLPQGYDTVLGQRGSTLSGGERQRLAIARALLKDAPVVILDEPTSALDSGTEAILLDALRRLMKDRTTLVIAHRLSTIEAADRIIVLDEGRVVELGTHVELLARDGLYRHLHAVQAVPPAEEVEA